MTRERRAAGRATLLALLAGAAFALAGCGGMDPSNRELASFLSKAADVDFGQTKVQVQRLMGPPRERLYSGNQEAWLWCETSSSPQYADAYLTVHFHNSQVVGIHTYGNRAEGLCETFFRSVEWIADPEKARVAKVRRRE
jgi:hypothetical protein